MKDKRSLFKDFEKFMNIFPNCRCQIITMSEEIYFTYATKYLIDEYLEECNKQDLWIN